MIRIALVVLALLAGSGNLLQAQNRQGQQRGLEAGPVSILLQLRDQLALTPTQVGQLERIDADMDRLNQPLVARISEIRHKIRSLGPVEEMNGAQRARFDTFVAEARPLWEQIQHNNAAAMKRVGGVLTEQQKEQVAKLLRQAGDNRERSGRLPQSRGRGN
jgi:hypothetical protein